MAMKVNQLGASVHEQSGANPSHAPCHMGDEAIERIAAGRAAGRACWWFAGKTPQQQRQYPIVVPRLELTARQLPNGVYRYDPVVNRPAHRLKSRLELFLEASAADPSSTVTQNVIESLKAQDRARIRHFAAVTLYDVYDWDKEEVAAEMDFSTRRFEQVLHEVRDDLRGMAAWPWACFSTAELRAPGFRAWRDGASHAAESALQHWEQGRWFPHIRGRSTPQ